VFVENSDGSSAGNGSAAAGGAARVIPCPPGLCLADGQCTAHRKPFAVNPLVRLLHSLFPRSTLNIDVAVRRVRIV
jgi:hypothetical protein